MPVLTGYEPEHRDRERQPSMSAWGVIKTEMVKGNPGSAGEQCDLLRAAGVFMAQCAAGHLNGEVEFNDDLRLRAALMNRASFERIGLMR